MTQKLLNDIISIFVKIDIIGVIKDGAPLDEYNMEAGKIYEYIKNHTNSSKTEIYNEVEKIMVSWLGRDIVFHESNKYIDDIQKISNNIYKLLSHQDTTE